MDRNYVDAVERAERMPSIMQAAKLARALGTTLSEMLAETEIGLVMLVPLKAGDRYPTKTTSPELPTRTTVRSCTF